MVRIYLLQKNIRIVWQFGFFSLSLQHRLLAQQWVAGGLI